MVPEKEEQFTRKAESVSTVKEDNATAAELVTRYRADINLPGEHTQGNLIYGNGTYRLKENQTTFAEATSANNTMRYTETPRRVSQPEASKTTTNAESRNINIAVAAENLVKESISIEKGYDFLIEAGDQEDFAKLIAAEYKMEESAALAAIKEAGITNDIVKAHNGKLVLDIMEPFTMIEHRYNSLSDINEMSRLMHKLEHGTAMGDKTLQDRYREYATMAPAEEGAEDRAADMIVDQFVKVALEQAHIASSKAN